MDAGVPIKAPVAGIAMGLIKEESSVTVLSDIQGMEAVSYTHLDVYKRQTQNELNQIASVLGVTYEQYFVLANGEQVK